MREENNKRIAKNTAMLYIRMLLNMAVSLFTIRIVLQVLGVEDYGIYSVVGGVVEMFSFLSNTMASASQRFFAFELGKNNLKQLKRTFSITVLIYGLIALLILLLGETVGLWLLNNKMVIPQDRLVAANWVYQFSILSFIVTIMTIPYNAIIIARENMTIFAYISIAEGILKLIIVCSLYWISQDKLQTYGILTFATTCLITLIYRTIARRRYEESRFEFCWDRSLFSTLISYSGWNLFGALTSVANNQGINILLNMFFGPLVNAAIAISSRVSTTISSFSSNFYTAVNPQIVKSYSSGDKQYMIDLVLKSSKFAFFLLLLISAPVLMQLDYILTIWLDDVSEYMILFTRLAIIYALVNSLESPLTQSVRATGNIKKYQIWVGSITLITLPASFTMFKLGFPPQFSIYILITVYVVALFVRLHVLKGLIGLHMDTYFSTVLYPVLLVGCISAIPLYLFLNIFPVRNIESFIVIEATTMLWVLLSIYVFGLTKEERQMALNFVKSKSIYI